MKKMGKYNIPNMNIDSVKESSTVYLSPKVNFTPSSWEIFSDVINDASKFEILQFIDNAKGVGINKNVYSDLLGVNLRTLNRYISGTTSLDNDKIEKALRLNNLINLGKVVFGSESTFSIWLFESNHYLNSAPINFLGVISGIEIIENVLGKIDYGVIG